MRSQKVSWTSAERVRSYALAATFHAQRSPPAKEAKLRPKLLLQGESRMIVPPLSKWALALLQAFFHWLYHEGAWAYDGVAALVSMGRWTRWVTRALERVEGTQVLELGHGPGHLLAAMGQRGLRPVGLDPSPAMGRRARWRTGASVPLVRGRAQALPFQDESFDTVVATFPAPFIRDPCTWREAARVLRPGGHVVVLFAAQPSLPLVELPCRWLYGLAGLRHPEGPPGSFLHDRAQQAGLEVEPWTFTDGPWTLHGILARRPPCP
jgi:ubiquinone/menaquinone biosynthesis C-methylase UbiE